MAMKSVTGDLSSIKPISKGDVHRICSGQVVLTLATAVKELVENSLDAGASVIDVRLKDYGSELVEVSDNGSGVHSDNFQALTLKHHTSKLQDFSDLLTVETFGFRGEALSSLCALSEVSITTRHSSSLCGTHLKFNSDGIITSSSSVARQVGTTVTLKNIFSTIPVRQKEFHRNLKREFAKMTQLLYAYCLVSTDVKITCTNLSKKDRKTTIVSTQSGKTIRENIASIFGPTQSANLLDWEYRTSDDDRTSFHLEGVISSCSHGCGRSANDRQFFYINSRPCEPTKLMRVVNEVYHQYNLHQSPFVFLNIKVPRSRVDVNVTPDKRQIFLDQENILLGVVRESLQNLFERIPSTLAMNNISKCSTRYLSNDIKRLNENNILNSITESVFKSDGMQSVEESVNKQIEDENHIRIENGISTINGKLEAEEINYFCKNDKSLLLDDIIGENKNSANDGKHFSEPSSVEQQSSIEMDETISDLDNKGQQFISDAPSTSNFNHWKRSESCKRSVDEIDSSNKKKAKQMKLGGNMQLIQEENKMKQFQGIELKKVGEKIHQLFSSKSSTSKSACEKAEVEEYVNNKNEISDNDIPSTPLADLNSPSICRKKEVLGCKDVDLFKVSNSKCNSNNVDSGYSSSEASENINCHDEQSSITTKIDGPCDEKVSRLKRTVRISLDDVKSLQQILIDEYDRKTSAFVRFRALIDPANNKQAEQELTREISKDMFANMDVIGQFNLGFIIAHLNSDLFIVDQHATDEKYNFEMLQKTTTLSNQRLVVPQKLELTPINECILMENIEIFRANGFEFQINENASPAQKVSLTAIPMSNNWTFGKEDIDELLFMLQDSPHTLCRPSRVRAMFASRACRKSVMIGTALTKSKMKTLLTHMGEIEQPWNCPHSRPTMRHLVNLDVFK